MPPPAIDLKTHLSGLFETALEVVAPEATDTPVVLERPKVAAHGDFACNVAMQLARRLKRNPREIAQRIIDQLPTSPWVARAEIAGAGFINLFLQPEAKRAVVRRILADGDANGDRVVDFLDLNIVLSFYGQSGPALPGDLDADEDVDFVDLNIVLSAFGTAC